ncbi:cyclic pyranopterin monophosphate synthase accessory protein, mitochondrial [Tanacetum coccineum]
MEFVFGKVPPTSLAGSSESQPMSQDSESIPAENMKNKSILTHISTKDEAQMVDISHKDISKIVFIASCKVILGRKAYDLVPANQVAKGDVLSVGKIAGIIGAKQTSNFIPLCHNINITHVRVDLRLNPHDYCVEIEGEAASTGKTGVEMEAMIAVTLVGLTVYDMCKDASKDITLTDVQLEHKTGGKSGNWSRKK